MKAGDEVIAVASGSFSAFVTADARAVVPKPSAFNVGQAATIPIAFLTAYYSLNYLAKLSRGERVRSFMPQPLAGWTPACRRAIRPACWRRNLSPPPVRRKSARTLKSHARSRTF